LINYKYVTVKNGMRFKRKWKFMFETEGGPLDDGLEWKSIERQPLEAIGPLEMVD